MQLCLAVEWCGVTGGGVFDNVVDVEIVDVGAVRRSREEPPGRIQVEDSSHRTLRSDEYPEVVVGYLGDAVLDGGVGGAREVEADGGADQGGGMGWGEDGGEGLVADAAGGGESGAPPPG